MYNISTGNLVGVNSFSQYDFELYRQTGSLQLNKNGKIYLILNTKIQDDGYGFKEVKFGNYTNTHYQSYQWRVINTPDVWNPSVNPLNLITPPKNAENGFSFPQLIPSLENVNTCPNTLDINYPITASENFQAGLSITASSVINNGLIVNYKAGQNITLNPGFSAEATGASLFHAYIGPCDGIASFTRNNNSSENYSKETKVSITSEVKIYPNPASDYITINTGNEQLVSWEMYDMSGKSVLRGNSEKIDVQNILKGSYLLKINLEKKQISKIVMIK